MSEPQDNPTLDHDGWMLESALSRSETNPNTFLIPSQSERKSLKVGQGVKLIFWIQGEEEFPICERMWVLVERRLPDQRYLGHLESSPETAGRLIRGQRLVFGPEHVAEIYAGSTGYEEGSRRGDA
jgi:hypothetical protein